MPTDQLLGEGIVVAHYREATPVHCPCGDSYRIKLTQSCWPMDFHLTEIRSRADEHQHRQTPEVYFIHRIHAGKPVMKVGPNEIELREGMVIAVPNETLHSIDGGDVDVFIFVGGGHKDDDFWDKDWNPIKPVKKD